MLSSVRHRRAALEHPVTPAIPISLCAVGFVIAGYLALVELQLFATAWDPVFGSASSAAVLHSSLAKALPVPDAALGAFGYGLEIALLLVGQHRRARRPLEIAGVVAVAMGLAGLALVFVQILLIRRLCLLCLCSAVTSVALAGTSGPAAAPLVSSLPHGGDGRGCT